MNKAIFNRFEFPLFVTCFQQIITWYFARLSDFSVCIDLNVRLCTPSPRDICDKHSRTHALTHPLNGINTHTHTHTYTRALVWGFGTLGRHFKSLSFAPPPEFKYEEAVAILPLTGLYVGMLVLTNACLQHVDISFYQVLFLWEGRERGRETGRERACENK